MKKRLWSALLSFSVCTSLLAPAVSVSACDLTSEELLAKYEDMCDIITEHSLLTDGTDTWSVSKVYAVEKNDYTPVCFSAEADAERTSGGYRYVPLENGTARITGVAFEEQAEDVSVLSVPSEIDGYSVTEIGKAAFRSAYKMLPMLREINIPDSVEIIAEEAFSNVFAYKFYRIDPDSLDPEQAAGYRINIPSNVKFIGHYAYQGCVYAIPPTQGERNIIHLPESLEYISSQAFDGGVASRLGGGIEVDMPESLVFMSDDTFHTDHYLFQNRKISDHRTVYQFADDIPEEYLPLVRSQHGQGFYNCERNIVSMKELLWHYLDALEEKPTNYAEVRVNPWLVNWKRLTDLDASVGQTQTLLERYENSARKAGAYELLPSTEADSPDNTDSGNLTEEPAAQRSGDVNMDTKLTMIDAVLLHRCLNEDETLDQSAVSYHNADVDSDGTITVQDAVGLLEILSAEK